MKMIKKILSMILVISMLVGLSVSAFAAKKPQPEQPKTYSVKEIDVEVVGNYEADSVTVAIGDKSVSNTSNQQLKEAEYDDDDNEWELKFKNNKSWKLSQYPTKDNVVVYLNGTQVSVQKVELDEGELDIKVSAPVNTYTVTINYVDAATNQPIEGVESKVYNDLKKGNKLNVKDDLNKQIDGYTRESSDGPNNGKVTVGNENIVYTVKYNKIPTYTVTVNYVDVDSKTVLDSETYSMQKNDEQKIEFKTISGYQLIDKKEFKCVDVVDGDATLSNNPVKVKCHKADSTVNVYYKANEVEEPETNTTAEIKVFITGEHEKKSATVAYGNYSASTTESGSDSRWENDGEGDHWELDLHGDDKWELPTELNAADFSVILDENEDLNVDVISVENRWDTLEHEFELYINVVVEAKPETYTVTWKNGEDVLETDEDVAVGTMPEYNGETPTKDEDETNTYEFAGWDPAITAVTGDAEYTATFTATKKETIEDEETPLDPTPAYPVYVYLKAPNGDAAATEKFGQTNSYGYYFVGMKELTGIPENDVTKYHQKTGTNKLTYTDYESVLAPAVAELIPEDILSRVTWGNFHVVKAKNDDESNSGLDTWHLDGVLKASEPEQPEPDPEPEQPEQTEPKTYNFRVYVEGAYVPENVRLYVGESTSMYTYGEDNFTKDYSGNYWALSLTNPQETPDENTAYAVELNGKAVEISRVEESETEEDTICIYVAAPSEPVCVYIQVEGNDTEKIDALIAKYFAKKTNPGYYTLGKLTVQGLPTANKTEFPLSKAGVQYETYAGLLADGSFDDYAGLKTAIADTKLPMTLDGYDIVWNVFHSENGADGNGVDGVDNYNAEFRNPDGSKKTVWHLDGVITIEKAEEPTTPPTDEPTTPPTDEPTTPPTDEPTTPPTDEPTTPPTDEPTTPPTSEGGEGEQQPDNGGNEGGIGGGDYYPPTPDTPVGGGDETIVDEDVPLGGEPEGDETIEDEDVPLGDMPEEELEEIEDEDVPLDATPKTGNALRMIRNIAFAIAALSFSGLMASVVITKKKFDF